MAKLSKDFVKFFKELAANNDREWFKSSKKRYEESVKKPFENLVENVILKIQKIDPEVTIEPKNAIFRIYRDIRFSKDKSPYKTHMAAVVSRGGRKDMQSPGVYFHLSASEHFVGGGCYKPDKENLHKIRMAIMKDPNGARKVLNSNKFRDCYPEGILGERNKILPKEFKEAAEEIPELFQKQFHYMAKYKGSKWVLQDDLDKVIVEHYKAGKAWNDFLAEAMNS